MSDGSRDGTGGSLPGSMAGDPPCPIEPKRGFANMADAVYNRVGFLFIGANKKEPGMPEDEQQEQEQQEQQEQEQQEQEQHGDAFGRIVAANHELKNRIAELENEIADLIASGTGSVGTKAAGGADQANERYRTLSELDYTISKRDIINRV